MPFHCPWQLYTRKALLSRSAWCAQGLCTRDRHLGAASRKGLPIQSNHLTKEEGDPLPCLLMPTPWHACQLQQTFLTDACHPFPTGNFESRAPEVAQLPHQVLSLSPPPRSTVWWCFFRWFFSPIIERWSRYFPWLTLALRS